MPRRFDTTAYRYPNEQLILGVTLALVFLVIVLTATATLCLSGVFILGMVALSFWFSRSHHQELIRGAQRVTRATAPDLASVAEECVTMIQTGPVEVFVAPSKVLNAYTFGLSSPNVVVIHSPVLRVMDADEVRFILGHELGHVRLGHTWLNSLVGGMAGIPSPFVASAILQFAFLWWNRACEYSADRAGLLACGDLNKAVSALVKLEAGPRVRSRADLEQAMRRIDAEDDHALSGLAESLGTHPMTINRIEALHRYAQSPAYQRLRAGMLGNLDG
ncbi:MAG: M48 family metallopeptidase [Anaerolineae bacterium]|nr:M48 family metallopeptidase [Anaerolineae bacterium]